MKRNSLFMWAYISSILVSIFLRFFVDYQLWNPLVLAITLSSIFFSVEDLYFAKGKAINDSCIIGEKFALSVHEKEISETEFFEKLDNATERFKGTDYDISDVRNSFNSLRSYAEQLKKGVTELESQIQSKRKAQKRYQKLADILAYTGFLVLFCTLILGSLITVPSVIQDMLTVFSFSVVLITHQYNILASEKIKKEMMDSQKALFAQAEARDALSKRGEKLDYLIECIDNLMQGEEEESDDAD